MPPTITEWITSQTRIVPSRIQVLFRLSAIILKSSTAARLLTPHGGRGAKLRLGFWGFIGIWGLRFWLYTSLPFRPSGGPPPHGSFHPAPPSHGRVRTSDRRRPP